MRHYFITGATGVVGSAFLERIAAHGETASVLVRADTENAARERLEAITRDCGAAPSAVRRIRPVRGDLCRPRMGLAADDYHRLADTCTHIVHCAGNVQMNLPLPEARRRTLAMTHNVLALLAACGRAGKMEFVSTVGVAGRTTGGIGEAWLRRPRKFRNSYEAAKAEAEEVVREKAASGLPITVHRPSMVVGDSRTGRTRSFQVFYYLCEFLSGRQSFGMLPEVGGMRLDIIPSDYVAALLEASALAPAGTYPVLHACSGKNGAIELKRLVKQVRRLYVRHGRKLPPVHFLPVPLFKLAIAALKPLMPARHQRALGALPYFLSYLEDEQYFGNPKTKDFIRSNGIALPEVDRYLETVLRYYLRSRPAG